MPDMSPAAAQEEQSPPSKRQKRTYKACFPCRSRKLKCSFGDPDRPWDGQCQRCLRERRECEQAPPNPVGPPPAARPSRQRGRSQRSIAAPPSPAPEHGLSVLPSRSDSLSRSSSPTRDRHEPSMSTLYAYQPLNQAAEPQRESVGFAHPSTTADHTLIHSRLHNPRDALRILASASSVHSKRRSTRDYIKRKDCDWCWTDWQPIKRNMLRVEEAEALLTFFELEMSPLYPILDPGVFRTERLPWMIKKESLLLGVIIAIAARYSLILYESRAAHLHKALSDWVRQQLLRCLDGSPSLRHVSTIEALLLMSEWPLYAIDAGEEAGVDEEPEALRPSTRYDAYSWNHIGLAVRMAQDMGLQNVVGNGMNDASAKSSWEDLRMLRIWAYAYNADRHVSVRLGRYAILQAQMSARWWERLTGAVARTIDPGEERDLGREDVAAKAIMACLLGTIQEHLYPHKEMTGSLISTGLWEPFLRSLRLEVQSTRRYLFRIIKEATVEAALVQIELDYLVLYGNAIALRALQEKLYRRRMANDPYYFSPSLLNMLEGPWILEALAAARSICNLTVTVLGENDRLRYCPSRISQRIMFAATFLYKALAIGVVEHGQQTVLDTLDRAARVMLAASLDDQHLVRSFAKLLLDLGAKWRRNDEVVADAAAQGHPAVPPSQPSHPTTLAPSSTQDHAAQPFSLGAFNATGEPALDFLMTGLGRLDDNDLQWGLDPTVQDSAVDREQESLLQSLWNPSNTSQPSRFELDNSLSSLYDTLLGDFAPA